ncbi:MAG: VWA domain-containing protein [Chitinophagales bacterium]
MTKFAHIEYLWALALLLLLLLAMLFFLLKRKSIYKKLGSHSLVDRLTQDTSTWRRYTKMILMSFAFLSLVVALANPLLGTKFEKVERNGVDVIFAIDVSNSMLAEDVTPSRMLKAKQFVSNMIEEMANDRVGLVVFAGNAYLQLPLTIDYSAAKMYLKTVDTEIVPTQGTAIGDAVRLAMKSFVQEEAKHKVLVVISDGENHEGEAADAIDEAVAQGIQVHTIGVGTTAGGRIPEGNGFKTDWDGEIVVSQLNEEMLKELASDGNGTYHNLEESDVESEIIVTLGAMEGKYFGESIYTEYKNQFPIFLAIAFCLLLIELFLGERKQNIFGRTV